MLWTSRRFILWGFLLSLLACSPGKSRLTGADLQVRMDRLALQQDTAALADLATAQCLPPETGASQSVCLEQYFTSLSSDSRVRLALGALSVLITRHPELEPDAHGFAHVIGILSITPGADLGKAFRNCTVLFQSGCYHGVIQAWMSSNHVDSTVTNQICERIAPDPVDRWLRFQCVHGLGHGLEMINNWDLPTALTGCDWLRAEWDRGSCYGGAFMENAIASIPGGHHTSATALAAAATASNHSTMAADTPSFGHSHSPDPSRITYQMRDPENPLYPCTSLSERYQFSCYQNQGGIILAAVQSDFSLAAAACDEAPIAFRSQCYLSLGSNASAMSSRNATQAIAWCSNGDPDFRPWCFVGVVKNFVDVTANPDDGVRFCQASPAGQIRNACYLAVGEETTILWNNDRASRAAACARAGEGEHACRIGAGLDSELQQERS